MERIKTKGTFTHCEQVAKITKQRNSLTFPHWNVFLCWTCF